MPPPGGEDRQQHIRNNTLTLNKGAPQGCVLSPLLYSLFTNNCMARHDSNTIITFADDTTVVVLITENDQTDRAVVEQVESFKFLDIHITNKLEWSKHTKTVVKRAQQSLFPLRKLKRFGMGPQILKRFYSCNIESITAWYGNCSASDRKALQRVVRTAQYITGAKLPDI